MLRSSFDSARKRQHAVRFGGRRRRSGHACALPLVIAVLAMVAVALPPSAGSSPPAGVSVTQSEQATADPEVLHMDARSVGASFEIQLNGMPATLWIVAGRNTTTSVPPQTAETSQAWVQASLNQGNTETGETMVWVWCQDSLADEALTFDGFTSASLVTTVGCTDLLTSQPVELTINLIWEADEGRMPRTSGRAIPATASGSVTFDGQTYAAASLPDTAEMTRFQWRDLVRIQRERIWQNGGATVGDDYEQLACVGASPDSFTSWTFRGIAVYAIDETGVYHLHLSGFLDATIDTPTGAYSGSEPFSFESAVVPSFDTSGTAVIPLSIPVTVSTDDGSSTARLIFDFSFFIFPGDFNIGQFSGETTRCAATE